MCPSEQHITSSLAVEEPGAVPEANIHGLPTDNVSVSANELAQSLLPPSIYNHSVRVYLYARWLAKLERSPWAQPAQLRLLFAACVLHDIGCTDQYNGLHRFEVEGADAAVEHLRSFNVPEPDAQEVWVAIACHASAHIAERISSLARLVRIAVLLDFKEEGRLTSEINAVELRKASADVVREAEGAFPVLEVRKELGDAVVNQAMSNERKAPGASWPGVMLRAKREEPDWTGVNKAF